MRIQACHVNGKTSMPIGAIGTGMVWKRISGNVDDGSGASVLHILNLSPDQGDNVKNSTW